MKVKKKLRELTEQEYINWINENCKGNFNCYMCTLYGVECAPYMETCWYYRQDLYSDKLLNREVEIENKKEEKDES